MRLSPWQQLNEKISQFEKKAAEKISEFKSGHPIIAGALSGLFSAFPSPLDSVAQGIFDNADGSEVDKTNAVLGYFKNMQIQGENHYNQIALKLDAFLIDINDVKQITAKESTLQKIQEILISSSKIADKKLDELKNELGQIGIKVNKIEVITNEDLKTDQATNQMVRELYSAYKKSIQSQKQLYDGQNILPRIEIGKDKEIPQSVKDEFENRDKEIEMLRTELVKLKQQPEFDIDYLLKEANTHYYTKEYEKAIGIYDLILKIDPTYVYALQNKGNALTNLGNYDEAIKYFDDVLKIDPRYVDALHSKGNALANLYKYDEAILYLDEAIRIYTLGNGSKYYEVFKIESTYVNALHNKGVILVNLGKFAEAVKCFDEALKIDPTYAETLSNKGAVIVALDIYKEAIKCFDDVLKIDPNNTDALQNKKILEKLKSKSKS